MYGMALCSLRSGRQLSEKKDIYIEAGFWQIPPKHWQQLPDYTMSKAEDHNRNHHCQ
jgi:hypothetical protein